MFKKTKFTVGLLLLMLLLLAATGCSLFFPGRNAIIQFRNNSGSTVEFKIGTFVNGVNDTVNYRFILTDGEKKYQTVSVKEDFNIWFIKDKVIYRLRKDDTLITFQLEEDAHYIFTLNAYADSYSFTDPDGNSMI